MVDLVKAYHRIPNEPMVIPETYVTTSFALHEHNRKPFGLRRSTKTFQMFGHKGLLYLLLIFTYVD